MKTLRMSPEEIRNRINLKDRCWKHIRSTNCYAYALGLDVKEKDIIDYAYFIVGTMAYYGFGMSYDDLSSMTFEERLFADLELLEIECHEISPKENVKKDMWKIALFLNEDGFHFMRQSKSGIWLQKWGYYGFPIDRDDKLKIITNPELCNIKYYDYVKSFALKLK